MTEKFEGFEKIARLWRPCVVTEKIDGTNAQVLVTDAGEVIAGSRKRYITADDDNFGFARWVAEHEAELRQLGPGRHFGEWWGSGIQRRYGLTEKRWSLFNTARWGEERPACCHVVPVLYEGEFDTYAIRNTMAQLGLSGSVAAPGFDRPEGIAIWHEAARQMFKATFEGDTGKWTKQQTPAPCS